MSDVAWIALIIVVYLAFIKPMMQGVMNTPPKDAGARRAAERKAPQQKHGETKDGEYVDYEEIK